MRLLIVIDLERAFINKYTKEYPDKINNLINKNMFEYVIFTKFINNINSPFYKIIGYCGCINKTSQEIVIDTKEYPIFNKKIYSAYSKKLKKYISLNNIDEVYLCGIDTDQCVLKTAVDLFENNINVKVLSNYSMSHSGYEYHKYGLELLKKFIGKENVIDI